MIQQSSIDLERSNSSPYDQLISREFIEGVLKAGALISMLENKKINNTMLFSLLLEKLDYREFFTEVTSSDSFKEAVSSLLYLYPSLVKSKITKTVVRKINGKSANRSRKTLVQQTSNCIKSCKKQTV